MCKFESLQKDESRAHLTDSSKAHRNLEILFGSVVCTHLVIIECNLVKHFYLNGANNQHDSQVYAFL